MDKMPAYRWRDAHRLAGFLKGAGPNVAEALEPRMAAVLKEGEEMPDLAHLFDVLGRMVVAEEDDLDQRDYEKQRHDGNAAAARRDLRQQAMPLLRSRVQEVRKVMRSHIDPEEIAKILDFEGRTPRSDEGLEDLATVMVRRLPVLKPIPTPGGSVDPAGWAQYLRQPLAQVSGLLGEIDGNIEKRSLSTEKKAEAMKTFDTFFRRVARVGWIFCHLAGQERDARKLVYKGGRPGVKVKTPRGPASVA